MVAEGICQIGDGLLEVAKDRLQALLVSGVDINEVYDVEHTPFARGKFAAVRRAVHKKTGVHFAAKFLRRRRRAQCTLREIGHEIAVLMLCADSKHIVKLHAVHESKTETALILELATGGELQAILDEDGSLTECQAQICMREILTALQYLHSKRIAHLDIKPQNILLCGDKVEDGLKLCDFGISRLVDEVGEVREILGTPDYVAPEVLQYEPLSLATDIWSIGVLAYVLLTGCSPFGGDTKQETFLNISQCNLHFPEDLYEGVSEEAMDFIRSALRIKPKERMTATECLNHQWLRCSPDTRAKISEQNSPQLILSPAEQTPEIRLQIATSQPSINHTLAATPSSKSNSFYDDTDDTLYDTRNPTMPPHVTCTPTNTTPVAAAPPSPPSNDLQKSLKDAALSPLIYFKDTASHCTNNKENLSCNVKFFGINFKTTASEMTTTVPTMATGPMHAVTPLPAKPGHMPPTSSHHHFPDAPTTPKVSRKSSPDSPPSVKALVKKFQLAAPDSQTTSSAADPSSPNCAATITQHHSRRTEFNASSYAPTNFDLTSDSAHPGDIAAAAQTAQHLCRPLNVSTASSSTTTTVVISASSSPSAGMPSSLCKPMSVEQGIIC